MNVKWRAGRLLMLTGIGHAFVGVALFYEALAAIVRDGVFDAIWPHVDRQAAFWFLLFSPLCFLLGQVVERAAERRDAPLLSLLGWNVLALGVLGVVLLPISGFWILIAIAPLVFKAARDLGRGSAASAGGAHQGIASRAT